MASSSGAEPPGFVSRAWHAVELKVDLGPAEDRDPWGESREKVITAVCGPKDNFRFRVKVYPEGRFTTSYEMYGLGVFIELLPPSHLASTEWACENVRYALKVSYTFEGKSWAFKVKDQWSFTKHTDQGHELLSSQDIRAWMPLGQLVCIRAEVELPDPTAAESGPLDFAAEPAFTAFRLAKPPALFFDRRILIQRSEYFRRMLTDAAWQEGSTNEIDLSNNPNADPSSVNAVLQYLLTDRTPSGDLEELVSVRKLADQFCLAQLVARVDLELEKSLCPENVLTLLGHVVGSEGPLEAMCMNMLQANSCEVLDRHRSSLNQVVDENPDMAKKLLHLTLKVARGRVQ